MKKTIIALLTLAAAAVAVSCQEEIEPNVNSGDSTFGQMTIKAVAEGIGNATKAEMAYKYDVLWNDGDQICVKDASESAIFTLTDGAGTTVGTFAGSASFSGEVEAFYPASIASEGSLVWPATQQNNQVAPMYCKNTLSGEGDVFSFSSLGAMLQIVFNSTVADIVLKSIEIKDGQKNLSGEFTVDGNGQANITATDGDGITLDLGSGKSLGKGANYFNIAIPAGKYNDVTIRFITTDGLVCSMHSSTFPEVIRNTVCRVTMTGIKFDDKTLPGVFNVGNGRFVRFSPGNLFWDGDSFEFEATQYDFSEVWDTSHIGYFLWSNNPDVAMAASYEDSDAGEHDVFFTNATEQMANPDFTVSGITGNFRTLSMVEWEYLLSSRSNADKLCKVGATVCGKEGCLIIAPDDFSGTIKDSYSASEWQTAEAEGLVCLSTTGYMYQNVIHKPSEKYKSGYYWSSAPYTTQNAHFLAFENNAYESTQGFRSRGHAVRLVKDKEFVTSVSIDNPDLVIFVNYYTTLTATVLPSDAPLKTVIWTSSNTDVATVSDDGKVHSIAPGTATITATAENAGKTASCTVTVKPSLSGLFTVDQFGRKVRFSCGNLYWDGDSFEFEASQYDYPTAWDPSHVGHFSWSSDPAMARSEIYADYDRKEDDYFFTNNGPYFANPNFVVAGYKGVYRTLPMDEWDYLFHGRTNASKLYKTGVTVCGKANCVVLAPDGYGGEIMEGYNPEQWEAAEGNGFVCLPAAGERFEGDISLTGSYCFYWSSVPYSIDKAQTAFLNNKSGFFRYDNKDFGNAIRLVTDKNNNTNE